MREARPHSKARRRFKFRLGGLGIAATRNGAFQSAEVSFGGLETPKKLREQAAAP
jgi:hypothetical protein